MAKKGETREVILDAAEKVFFQNGFEKTSVKMILEEAQIVTGSFYHFFPSKEALFEAVTERFLNAYAERIGGMRSFTMCCRETSSTGRSGTRCMTGRWKRWCSPWPGHWAG